MVWIVFILSILMTTVGYPSIYSSNGIGVQSVFTNGSFAGRAGLGLANFDTLAFNPQLPSHSAHLVGVKFQVGMQIQNRGVKDSLKNTGNQGELFFSGIGLSTPLYKSLRIGFLVSPFTINKSSVLYVNQYANERYWTKFDGTGSINKYSLIVSNKNQNFAYGIENAFLIGTITTGWKLNFENATIYDGWHTVSRKYYGYRPSISVDYLFANDFRFAGVITPASKLNATIEIRDSLSNYVEVKKSVINLPNAILLGLAKKVNDWSLGTDFYYGEKSSSEFFPNAEIRSGIWTEYVKRYSKLDPYYQKIFYRAGMQFAKLGLNSSNGKQVNEIVFAAGIGLPFEGTNNRLDVAFGFIQRGSQSINYSEEKITFTSISLVVAETWFERMKPKRK